MGYHQHPIKKGTLGEFSKIEEEIQELLDGHAQQNKLLELCELADLLGAIEAYVARYNLTLEDLNAMKELTKKAFKDGSRR
jgi:predicted house-cleaning noncanonical NTP pyrophosphatase (MazG superfamily)